MRVKTVLSSPPRIVNAPAAAITTSAPTSAYSTVDCALQRAYARVVTRLQVALSPARTDALRSIKPISITSFPFLLRTTTLNSPPGSALRSCAQSHQLRGGRNQYHHEQCGQNQYCHRQQH